MERAMAGDQASVISRMFNTARVLEPAVASTSQACPDLEDFNRTNAEYVTNTLHLHICKGFTLRLCLSSQTNCPSWKPTSISFPVIWTRLTRSLRLSQRHWRGWNLKWVRPRTPLRLPPSLLVTSISRASNAAMPPAFVIRMRETMRSILCWIIMYLEAPSRRQFHGWVVVHLGYDANWSICWRTAVRRLRTTWFWQS